MRRVALLVVGALLCALSCVTTSDGPVGMTRPADEATSWEEILREHTRRAVVYDWPDRKVDLRAALVTPRLRSAFIASRDRFHGRVADRIAMDLLALGQPPDEGVDAPLESRPRAEEQVIFYVAFWAESDKWRELAASYSIWDVELSRGDARESPIVIERERYSPAFAAIFPFADRFDEVYVFRFPLVDPETGKPFLSPGGEPLRLEVTSALATATLTWTLE